MGEGAESFEDWVREIAAWGMWAMPGLTSPPRG
jgi:hypothetical protein